MLGCEQATGAFTVIDICYPGLPPQNPIPSITEPKFVVFMSGFNIGGKENVATSLSLEMLVDYLTGQLGDDKV